MSVLFAFLDSWAAVANAIGELIQYGWRLLKNMFLPQGVLAARVLVAESQLALCQELLGCNDWKTPTTRFLEGSVFMQP